MLHRGGDVEGRESEIRRCPDLKGETQHNQQHFIMGWDQIKFSKFPNKTFYYTFLTFIYAKFNVIHTVEYETSLILHRNKLMEKKNNNNNIETDDLAFEFVWKF